MECRHKPSGMLLKLGISYFRKDGTEYRCRKCGERIRYEYRKKDRIISCIVFGVGMAILCIALEIVLFTYGYVKWQIGVVMLALMLLYTYGLLGIIVKYCQHYKQVDELRR